MFLQLVLWLSLPRWNGAYFPSQRFKDWQIHFKPLSNSRHSTESPKIDRHSFKRPWESLRQYREDEVLQDKRYKYMRGWKTGWRGGSNNMFVPLIVFHSSTSYWRKSVFVIYKSFSRTYWLIPPWANTWLSGPEVRILTEKWCALTCSVCTIKKQHWDSTKNSTKSLL